MAVRVDGIMSGLDTEALVKLQVSHMQSQIDRLMKQKQTYTWQRERYHSLYSSISTTRDSIYNFKLDATTKIKSVSTNSSNVSVVANADAVNGNHTLVVDKIATYAQMGSTGILNSSATKGSLADQFILTPNTTLNFTLNPADPSEIISINTDDSINDFIEKVNSSKAGITMKYDSNLDRIFIQSKETGADAKIDFTAHITSSPYDPLTATAEEKFLVETLKLDISTPIIGTDAEFTLDGVAITQKSNEFTFENVKYTLNEADKDKTIYITIGDDVDAIYQSLVDFVDTYNNLLDLLNSTLYESKNKGYEPLTDEEKSELTADQISTYEELAKAGILRGDKTLRSLVSDMRSILYSTVDGIGGSYKSLISIGVTTTNWSELGRLTIDEDKVKAALAEDPEIVNKLLNGGRDREGNRTDGIADKLYDRLKIAMDDIDTKSGVLMGDNDVNSVLAKRINNLTTSINKKIDRMNAMMESYYKQYDYLEQLLYQMQNQQDALYNYLG